MTAHQKRARHTPRELAVLIVRGRRVLLSGVVRRLQDRYPDVDRLAVDFEDLVHSLPLPLQFERHLTARVHDPAHRTLQRVGVLGLVEEVERWAL